MSNPKGLVLTDEEIDKLLNSPWMNHYARGIYLEFARAIESAVLRRLRESPADAWIVTFPGEAVGPLVPKVIHRTPHDAQRHASEFKGGEVRALHIIPGTEE